MPLVPYFTYISNITLFGIYFSSCSNLSFHETARKIQVKQVELMPLVPYFTYISTLLIYKFMPILGRNESREKHLLTIANMNIILSNEAHINSCLYFIQISLCLAYISLVLAIYSSMKLQGKYKLTKLR